jgi:hypothetical protein
VNLTFEYSQFLKIKIKNTTATDIRTHKAWDNPVGYPNATVNMKTERNNNPKIMNPTAYSKKPSVNGFHFHSKATHIASIASTVKSRKVYIELYL